MDQVLVTTAKDWEQANIHQQGVGAQNYLRYNYKVQYHKIAKNKKTYQEVLYYVIRNDEMISKSLLHKKARGRTKIEYFTIYIF